MVLRLVESDLHRLISSTVEKILKENAENNGILSIICQKITELQNEIDWTGKEGDLEIPLDDEGNNIAFIQYEVEDNRYLVPGQRSFDMDVPDDPDYTEGDYDVFINDIVIYDSENNEHSIEDNGMVTNLLKSLVTPDESGLEYYNDDQSGWNDRWR